MKVGIDERLYRWGERVVPAPLFRRLVRVSRDAQWRYDPRAVASRRGIEAFRNAYRGRRCFILGNGPSLNKTDLSLLRGEVSFGLNRIYLLFEKLGFTTSFLVSVNVHVIEQFRSDFETLPCPRFLSWDARDVIDYGSGMYFLRTLFGQGFSHDPAAGIYQGCTVTFVAMQLALFMGFDEVYLIGVDHSFTTKGQPHKLVTSEGADPNHFDPSYFGKGVQWQLPDLENSERAYEIARQEFEGSGRKIEDATIGGKLEVFPKRAYGELFDAR